MVGLVESYSIKSWGAGHLRSLARLTGSRSAEPARELPKKAKRLDDTKLSAFQARYREGATVEMLAREFGVHRTTVMAFTKRLDLHRHVHALSDPQIQQAAVLYQDGESLAGVAKHHGVGVETMRTALLAYGQELRPRGRPRREATRV
ncbi:hypothetical protein [Microbacterium testaceum]|uniref:hypothetical protein n=1 Tax=Microbacterium testaceum TaxID=2033 RepID=UPI002AC3752F|nr:hypothetical protein [Microbacterium testaceum]MDZ5144536.1 hypothetical protein [Microbacterium testaceum]